MKNSDQYLTFFPGQGICLVPSAEGLVRVPQKKDAVPILESLSAKILGKSSIDSKENNSSEAAKLYEFYKKKFGEEINTNPESALNAAPEKPLIFDIHKPTTSDGTRISFSANPIDWEKLENHLASLGYTLSKRNYFDDLLEGLCNVYVLSHPEKGVISEGKGVEDAQARRSALAEGVERMLAADHARAAERSRLSRAVDLENHRSSEDATKRARQQFAFGEGPRDSYTENMLAEWIPTLNISTNTPAWMPTELAYFQYEPMRSHLRLFSLTHTMGLAAGSSTEDATMSGIFEVLERDAYWIIMRNRLNCPDIDLSKVIGLSHTVLQITSKLKEEGITLSIKDASLDWGIAIAHVVLSDSKGRIPAFSHGMGAGFDWATAIARAVTEVVQVHSGMYAFTQDHGYWQDIVGGAGVLGRPEFAWADPLFYPHIKHLLIPSDERSKLEVEFKTPEALLEHLKQEGHAVMLAKLGEIEGLQVVRVLISGTTHPDERLERVTERMKKFAKKETKNGNAEWKGFYADPILT